MTRKTVPYKDNTTTIIVRRVRKNGCANPVIIKENDLIACITGNVKAHITNIASLESLMSGLDSTRMAHELAGRLKEQIVENNRRLEKIREYKAGLYENMMNGNLNKDEHKALKGKYADDTDLLTDANVRLQSEIEAVLSCEHEQMAWMEHFTKFENLEAIDRRMVIHLIHSILILGKRELEITFNYQIEYENASAFVRKEVV